jgi:hypothetical protein
LKATRVVAAAVLVGSEFQSQIFRGKKEYFLSSLLLDGTWKADACFWWYKSFFFANSNIFVVCFK